ncbi:UNVERIFIED_CONTAM: hypothetical protein Sradi_5788500 [Sesamum radiatum]|uniref:Uncharacterized protein n=1 Tax=Sesamum radiatum TaxID=300843 RepID=A0AAW2KNB0_SESRA
MRRDSNIGSSATTQDLGAGWTGKCEVDRSVFLSSRGKINELISIESGHCQSQYVKLFGALESFRVHDMPNLVEWTFKMSTNNAARVVDAFPCLKSLVISKCPNLTSAPSHGFPSLEELRISEVEKGSELLDIICGRNLSSVRSLELHRVLDLTCLPDSLFYNESRLTSLKIMECPNLTDLEFPRDDDHASNASLVQRLERLYIIDCSKLKSIKYPREQSESQGGGLLSLRDLRILNCETLADFASTMLESSTSLGYLMVSNCPKLTSFPVDFERMPDLYYLEISHCRNLRRVIPVVRSNCLCHLTQLTLGSLAENVSFHDFCRDFESILSLRSLEDLTLDGNRDWTSLPHQLQQLTALTRLSLSYFGVRELPEWFGNFSSLRTLSLSYLQYLRRFPDAMRQLRQLNELYLNGCPDLTGRWKGRDNRIKNDLICGDPNFPKFCHVQNVYVNGMVMFNNMHLQLHFLAIYPYIMIIILVCFFHDDAGVPLKLDFGKRS